MDDDNQLSRTNEKKLLMTIKTKKKIVLYAPFNGLVIAASTEYLFPLRFIHFKCFQKLASG